MREWSIITTSNHPIPHSLLSTSKQTHLGKYIAFYLPFKHASGHSRKLIWGIWRLRLNIILYHPISYIISSYIYISNIIYVYLWTSYIYVYISLFVINMYTCIHLYRPISVYQTEDVRSIPSPKNHGMGGVRPWPSDSMDWFKGIITGKPHINI